jgi:DNA-directed RNA polymerase alpha subunit
MTQAWDYVNAVILWQGKLDVLSTPIEEIEFGKQKASNSRIWYALARHKITTIADLIQLSRDELKAIPNLGKLSCRQIEHYLVRHGLALRPR